MRLRIISCVLALVMLCGCSLSSVDELFSIPKLPQEYTEFNAHLNTIISSGAELTAPLSGYNRQSVQFIDLDSDGIDEGIAFMLESIDDIKKPVVYIFKKTEDEYNVFQRIEGQGNVVESVSYSDLVGNGNYAVIIGWSLNDSSAKTLTAYEINEEEMLELVNVPYLHYAECDMDNDGVIDLNIVLPDEKNKALELSVYSQDDDEFRQIATAYLSRGINEIKRIRVGKAQEGIAGIFIDSEYMNNSLITDVFVFEKGKFINAMLEKESKYSSSTLRAAQIYCEDVDLNGTIEIPLTQVMPGKANSEINGILWYNYDSSPYSRNSMYSYHDFANNWHIMLPSKWRNKVYVEPIDSNGSVAVYTYSEGKASQELFSVYVYTGEKRYEKASATDKFQLIEKGNTIYAASIKEDNYLAIDITEKAIRDMFFWRQTEWGSAEVVVS